MASWRAGTAKQYQSYLLRWETYCKDRHINQFKATVENGIDFLATLYQNGLGYSAINTARSALSSVLTLADKSTFGQHPLVARFLKGIFELKPSLPRYSSIWDVGVVLHHIKRLHPITTLDLKTLSKKLTVLLCLLTGQRCQTITKLNITHMQELPDKYIFTIEDKIKTTRPGKHLQPIELLQYPADESLCITSHLKLYLDRTHDIRGDHKQLLLSYVKPHNPISQTTVGKWVKSVLMEAGVDVTRFSGNSGRAAATSYSAKAGLSLQEILRAGGWSNAMTFGKFYNKPIDSNFGATIINHFTHGD